MLLLRRFLWNRLLSNSVSDLPNISTWLSLIPFTSPVAMLLRIPFGVPVWQVVLSMLLLLATFPLCIWAAAKIYRSAILRYGQKTTWRDVWHLIKR